MKVKALSLRGILFEGEALSVNVKTQSGDVTILDHHRPLISVLSAGRAVITDSAGAKKTIPVRSGFLEMSRQNELSLLID